MTKAEDFYKEMQDILERQKVIGDNLADIESRRSSYQIEKDLFVSVTDNACMEVHISNSSIECERRSALNLAQWIQHIFGSFENKRPYEEGTYSAEEIRAKENQL